MSVQVVFPARFLIIQDKPVPVNEDACVGVVKINACNLLSIRVVYIKPVRTSGCAVNNDSRVFIRVADTSDLFFYRNIDHICVRDHIFYRDKGQPFIGKGADRLII